MLHPSPPPPHQTSHSLILFPLICSDVRVPHVCCVAAICQPWPWERLSIWVHLSIPAAQLPLKHNRLFTYLNNVENFNNLIPLCLAAASKSLAFSNSLSSLLIFSSVERIVIDINILTDMILPSSPRGLTCSSSLFTLACMSLTNNRLPC